MKKKKNIHHMRVLYKHINRGSIDFGGQGRGSKYVLKFLRFQQEVLKHKRSHPQSDNPNLIYKEFFL